MPHIVIAGQEVADKIEADYKTLPTTGGFRNSEPLCEMQIRHSRAGYCEAEIVKSMYGYSLRYASGLDNWAVISPACGTDGTLERAIDAAKAWVAQAPGRRYVTMYKEAES